MVACDLFDKMKERVWFGIKKKRDVDKDGRVTEIVKRVQKK